MSECYLVYMRTSLQSAHEMTCCVGDEYVKKKYDTYIESANLELYMRNLQLHTWNASIVVRKSEKQ